MPTNHFSASLSDLDMEIVRHIPPGGNWKDVPSSVPSKRLESIRLSFARGEGSRSTYYGRLRPDAPSYTINTYFNRPGNGCHIHSAQDRVISQREAARFQSFPDRFRFGGSKGAVNKQIGNAVPPVLAYQVARTLGEPGYFVDLFAGAGGLSLGFIWAGWKPIVANDCDANFLATYAENIHPTTVCGDIRERPIRDAIVGEVREWRRLHSGRMLVLGGPPCQGFSTAGNRRSMHDERNALFWDYRTVLDAVSPDGFVFENVTGLLNMGGGAVFREVRAALSENVSDLRASVLKAEDYAVPQRRWRVFLLGVRSGTTPKPPPPVTAFPEEAALTRGSAVTPSALDAIGDLPSLQPGEDGSEKPLGEPSSGYQRLMRGEILVQDYLNSQPLPSAERGAQQLLLDAV